MAKVFVRLLCLFAVAAGLAQQASAEPYLAIRSGQPCASCHTNPTGGGMRTVFGQVYGQHELTAAPGAADLWMGNLNDRISIGGNARVSATQVENADRDDNLDFGVDRVTLYGGVKLNKRVSLYLDQQIAPGGSLNREAWVKIDWGQHYIKAGRLFLPFGWRLEDNSALVREGTGISMTQGDDGVEIGGARGQFEWQLAAANGNGGGAEVDDGKLFALRGAWRGKLGQVGFSALNNSTDRVERRGYGVFAGLKTGSVSWLAELDQVEDRFDATPTLDQTLGLLEANWLVTKGHNIKLTAEARWADAERDRYRYSLLYEFSPWPLTQLRAGVRVRESNAPEAALSSSLAFLQLHAYF